ncbi:MAG: zinc ribbon domain-containing protein [Thermoprotei archaeon]
MTMCPYCKAEFDAPLDTEYITCPYCGTVFQIKTGNIKAENHFFYPINIDSTLSFKNLISFLTRQYGAPKDINNASITKRTLHYLPLHLYEGRGYAKCPNGSETYYETQEAYLALVNPPIPIYHEYRFPVRGKIYFKPNILEYGKYYNPEISDDGFKSLVESSVYNKISREIILSCQNPQINVTVNYQGLIHYPFWEFTYQYNNELYKGIVDAVDGIVVYAEYPQELGHRRIFATIGIISIITGLTLGTISGLIIGNLLLGIIGGLISGVIGGLRLLSRSARHRIKTTQLKERMGTTNKEELRELVHDLGEMITRSVNLTSKS